MPTIPEISYCYVCNERITWTGAAWISDNGRIHHAHPAAQVDELERLYAEISELKKRYEVLLAENESLRRMLTDERDQEMPY